ncbi:PQQ-binding-like beta-propeller repeat protein [Natrinema salaciae]|uniref:Tat (Twin-arginine translocation) pathway signal sequence n=1 Tax=Natrinema salaciae TaxID=1186196 RepID=A0A1H9KB19_9EURY|nr:PQQ-binding-like beta-propeller repeat protein [Natrinema salaciae]SEQ96406.1 Tat (twin-arginine translocation) pathway signal sequence [Natrinema salaciae]
MPQTRRRFLKGCATAAAAGSVLTGTGGAVPTDDTAENDVRENDVVDELPPHPPEAAGGWSAFRGGYGKTAAVGSDHGFGDGFAFDTLEADWTADVAGLPVVDDGTAYVSVDGTVRALNAADGSIEWQSKAVGASEPPTVGYGTVYVSGEKTVTALDSASGDVLWQTALDADDPSVSAPTVAFERVYVCADGTLYAIDCETGTIDWRRDSVTINVGDPWNEPKEVERAIGHEVVANDEHVFTIAESGTIAGLDPLTGEEQLATDTYYYHLSDLTATDDSVFVRTESEAVVAYDSSTGERDGVWDGGIRRFAVRGGMLVFVTRYRLVAVDLESGDQQWAVGNYSHCIGEPVIACNTVLVSIGLRGGEYKNSLVAFDLDDGSEQWVFSRAESASVGGRCVVANRTIYIDDGGLTAIRRGGSGRDGSAEDGSEDGESDDPGQDGENGDADHGGEHADRGDENETDREPNDPGNGGANDQLERDDDGGDAGGRGNHTLLLRKLLTWMP